MATCTITTIPPPPPPPAEKKIVLELTEKEAQVLKLLLGQVQVTTELGRVSESIWNAMREIYTPSTPRLDFTEDNIKILN